MIRENRNIKPTSCMADRDIIRYLRKIAFKASNKFNLKIKSFNQFPADHDDIATTAGICDYSRRIYINLYDTETGSYYSLEGLIDTVLHEVAHLPFRHGSHNREFWGLLKNIKDWYYKET